MSSEEEEDEKDEVEECIAAWIANNTWNVGPEPKFISELRERFEIEDIAEFLGLMDKYCHGCWNTEGYECYCQRDI